MPTWEAFVGSGTYTTYNLSNGNPFKLLSISGVGNAPVRRLEQRGPFQDGVTDIGYRFDARIINLVIAFNAAPGSTPDTHRDTLSDIFNPAGQNYIRLRCTRDDSSVRQIDCYAVGMVDMPAEIPERVMSYQRVAVQLKAPNPMWYDPTVQALAFAPTSTASPPEWRYAGGLIGTASLIASAENPAQGSAFTFGTTSLYWYTVIARTARPSSGTETLWSLKSLDGSQDAWFAATGSADYRYNPGFGSTDIYTGANYPAGTALMVFRRHDSNGVRGDIYRHDGSALTNIVATIGTIPINYYPGTAGYWRSTPTGGSAWASEITHAALYNVRLDGPEINAIANLIEQTTSDVYGGTVTMDGSYLEYPIVQITGPVADPIITNVTTGEMLDFTGSTISAGQSYYIDTRYGFKTVTDSSNVNRIAQLTNSSDLSTFHLDPGANYLKMDFSGGTSAATAVNMSYYNRYIAL